MEILGIILGLVCLLLLFLGFVIYKQNQKPNIELGLENGKLKEIPLTPNCISTQTSQREKLVEAMVLKSTLEESKNALKNAFNKYGSIEIIKETDDYMYAIATTGLMKYHDDIEIYFDQDKQVIEFRSASRAGRSDLGLNRKRYNEIVNYYNEY